jgi:predicted metal-dependent peptidase
VKTDEQTLISASLLRLRMKSPFFATVALFARFIPTEQYETAATDGKDVFFNPAFVRSLSLGELEGVLLHEVLHAALLHSFRCGERDPELWNIAADIVINGIILAQKVFELPSGGLRCPRLEHLSVEAVYEELLRNNAEQLQLSQLDLLGLLSGNGSHQPSDNLTQNQKAALEAHWRNALQQATTMVQTIGQDDLPAGMGRELSSLNPAQLDWRSHLWRYLVQTPTDFAGFDRRLIGRGLYLETLQGESVRVFVAVDTSGSIDATQLQLFLSEIQGILGAYPHIQCELYYADANVYGPYELNANAPCLSLKVVVAPRLPHSLRKYQHDGMDKRKPCVCISRMGMVRSPNHHLNYLYCGWLHPKVLT